MVSTLLTERSNECPSRLQRRCVEQCSNDRDCDGQICCYNGCGHTCERSRRDQRRGNVVSPVRTGVLFIIQQCLQCYLQKILFFI
ncbi:anosmin-1-like [Mytilus galloprovincialis]|uniref:anosmin-1-like n=1 Tax=Mytilus galloprovincialis TaxID=29158 RepID=UPI003F7C5732